MFLLHLTQLMLPEEVKSRIASKARGTRTPIIGTLVGAVVNFI